MKDDTVGVTIGAWARLAVPAHERPCYTKPGHPPSYEVLSKHLSELALGRDR